MSTYQSRKNVVSRFGLSQKSLLATSALTAAGLIGFGAPAHAVDDYAVWSVGHYEGGTSANITGSGQGYVQYTANTDRVIAVLDQKHIGKLGHVDINAALWVAKGTGVDPMQILGKLTSTGQLLVIDGNGVFFGPGSRVDAAGLIATTGDISNAQILNNNFGDYEINGATSGAIENHGMINVSEAGLAAFVAPTVRNSGVINAKLGKVVFASGEKVTLDLYGDGLFEVAVDGELTNALIDNTGTINAEGGSVNMTAAAAKDAVDNIINVSGVVNVASATQQGGKIVLSGGSKGKVTVSGTLDASGTNGGDIDIKGQNINVADTAQLKADGGKGADGIGNAGQILAIAEDHMDFRGNISGRGGVNGGNGGFSEVSGYGALGFDGLVDLSAENGEAGSLLLDPTFAVIHSGILNNPLGFNYIISAQALANSLRFSNVTVQADNFIDVGTQAAAYNTGNGVLDFALNSLTGGGNIDVSTWQGLFTSGITNRNLTLDSSVVNINKDLILGTGNVRINAPTLNLDGKVYGKTSVGGATTLLGDSRLVGLQNLTNINVLSNKALINQAIGFGDSTNAKLVTVAAGTYAESVLANKANMTLQGAANHASVITPNSPGFHVTANNVTVDGFTINSPSGADGYGVWVDNVSNTVVSNNIVNNSAGIASLYVVGSTNTTLQDNEINNSGIDSIRIVGGTNTDILGNVLNNSGTSLGVNGIGSGIVLVQANDVLIDDNDIVNAARIGVYAGGSSNVTISNNRMSNIGSGTNTAVGDSIGQWSGVHVEGTNNLAVSGNTINGTTGDGINLGGFINPGLNGGVTGTILVNGNRIFNTGDDGIEVLNSANATVSNNIIGYTDAAGTVLGGVNNVAGVGVRISNGNGAVVRSNKIAQTGGWGAIEILNTNGAIVGGPLLADGNNIRNSAADGVRMENSSNVTVQNNDIDTTGRVGIWGGNVNTVNILNNIVKNDLLGDYGSIHADGGSNWTVSNNDVDNGDYGILLNGTTGTNLISSNQVDGMTLSGIRGQNVSNLTVSGNTIGLSGVGAITGIQLFDGANTRVVNNNIYGVINGITANGVNGLWIDDNTIDHNLPVADPAGGNYGIYVVNSNNVQIGEGSGVGNNGNNIDDFRTAIYAANNTGTTIIDANDITDADWGVYISGVAGLRILDNEMDGRTAAGLGAEAGIYVENSNGAVIGALGDGNIVRDFLWHGIHVNNSDDVHVSHNQVDNVNYYGIRSDDSANLTVSNNTVGANGPLGVGNYGIGLFRGTNTRVVDNNVHSYRAGIWADSETNLLIDGNNVDYSRLSDVPAGGNFGIYVANSHDVQIGEGAGVGNNGNNIDDYAVGIHLQNNSSGTVTVDANDITDANWGIYVASDYGDLRILDNEIDGRTAAGRGTGSGIYVANADGAVIGAFGDGNIVRDFSQNGIELINSNNTSTAYNTINNVGIDGIYVGNSTSAQVISNLIGTLGGANNIGRHGVAIIDSASARVYSNTITGFVDTGVFVDPSPSTQVSANIITGGLNGVVIDGSDDSVVAVNTITGQTVNGVWVRNGSDDVTVDNNTIRVANGTGVRVDGGNDHDVQSNTINGGARGILLAGTGSNNNVINNFIGQTMGTSGNAIEISGNTGLTNVSNNDIDNAGFDGINVNSGTGFVNVLGNNIYNTTGASGIAFVFHNGDGFIANNVIDGADRLGIYIGQTNNLTIHNNNIRNTGREAGWFTSGIHLEDADNTTINANTINTANNGGDGIRIGGAGNWAAVATTGNVVTNNIIGTLGGANNISGDGIEVQQSAGANISGNRIVNTVDDGIEVLSSANAQITNNIIGYTDAAGTVAGLANNIGNEGIDVDNSAGVQILNNRITQTVSNGISINPSPNAVIQGNNILNVDGHGILVNAGSHNSDVLDNIISGAGLDGIRAEGSNNLEILRNQVRAIGTTIAGALGYGIYVNGGTLALIEDNQILGGNGASGVAGRKGAGLNAIHVDNNDGVRIIDNTVRGGNGQSGFGNAGGVGGSGAGGHGIYITQSSGAVVSENDVLSGNNNGLLPVKNGGRGADLGGIYAINNAGINAYRDGIQIISNVINNANAALSPADVVSDDGIYVENSGHVTTGARARIHDNTVSNVGEDGIDVRSTNGVIITSNRIDDAEEMGIKVDASNSALVQLNTIGTGAALNRGAGIDGIHVTNSRNVSIDQNLIRGGVGSSGAGRDGIRVLDSREASITNNTIRANGLFSVGAINDGIHVDNSGAIIGGGFDAIFGQLRDGVVITGNQILSSGLSLGAGNDGIFVNNSAGGLFATPPATISLNTVTGVGRDGIHVQSTNGAQITSNTITAAGRNGIYVNPSSFVTVANNIITLAGANGIYMLGGAVNSILNNTISLVGIDGIHVEDVLGLTITGNSVTAAGDDGIDVANSGPATINNNTVIGVVDNGIILAGSALANVNGNTITGAGTDGINVTNALGLNVNNNIITGVGDDGIDVSTSAPANINGNSVTGAVDNGIILTGSALANVNNNTILGVGTDGINVSNVLGLTVDGNSVTGVGDDGIDVSTSAPATVTNNTILGALDNGIILIGSVLANVSDNSVTAAGTDGIHIENVLGLNAEGNTVVGVGDDGIDVNGVIGFNISGNTVALSGDNGIELSNAALGLVGGNLIGLSGNDGINGQNLAATLIAGNLVALSGDDGIDVGNGIGVGIVGNAVLGALDNGIEVDNAVGILIAGNAVVGAGNNGIQLTDAILASINNNFTTLTGNNGIRIDRAIGLNVSDNLVTLAGDDGIDADNIVLANISGNTIAGVLSNGIEVGNALLVNISDNNVVFTGNDGIHVENSALVGVRNNTVAFTLGDGIDVEDTFGVAITGNTVRFAADNGIELQNSDTVLIDNNDVRFVGDNGIYVNPSNNVTISNNTINDTLDDGIDVNGGNAITITNNLIGTLSGNIGDDGIDVDGSSNVTISNNQITDAGDAGIELSDTNGVNILFNDIYENGNYGLWARGAGNESIVLSGNTFTDNRVGARFESGAIDLTDLANPNRFIFTPGFISDALNPAVGMQFDLAPGALPTDLTIVGETLGSTIFEGFLARPVGESFYVRFEDGAILDAGGGVITIDGTLASWDGIVPATFPGLILPLATLNAIEARLFDADDAAINGRGQIFVGFPPLLGLNNVEDFFNRFGNFGTGPSGLNLTITGLPRLTPGALNLGAITPFAGGEEGVAGIEPAAGEESGQGQPLDSIEPASGGNDAACWGDALNAAVNGSVSYNFTGDMQEMMNDASSCGTVVGSL